VVARRAGRREERREPRLERRREGRPAGAEADPAQPAVGEARGELLARGVGLLGDHLHDRALARAAVVHVEEGLDEAHEPARATWVERAREIAA
jgi:hypothetical protein